MFSSKKLPESPKIVDLGIIDPTQFDKLSPQQQRVLYQYLTKNKNKEYFSSSSGFAFAKEIVDSKTKKRVTITQEVLPREATHIFEMDGITYTFALSHNIFYRPSEYQRRLKNPPLEYADKFKDTRLEEEYFDRFEIISQQYPLGIGGCGAILKLAGTLAPKINGKTFELKTHTSRVCKIQKAKTDIVEKIKQENDINNETNIMSHFEYLRAKTSKLINGYYFTEMHEISGVDFTDFLNSLLKNTHSVNNINVIDIIILMLKSVKYFHEKNYMHLDIKPENFIYNQRQNVLKLVDFGFSKRKDDINTHCIGLTYGYDSPEQRESFVNKKRGVTEKADIYSLGKTFELIINFLEKNFKLKFPALLKSTIAKMCQASEHARPNIGNILEVIEKVILDLSMERLSDADKNQNHLVMSAAQTARKEYDAKLMSATKPTRDDIKKIISDSLTPITNTLNNNPGLINLYTKTLGIESFTALQSEQDIIQKIDESFKDFEKNSTRLLNMAAIFERLETQDKKNMVLLSREVPMHFHTMKTIDKHHKYDGGLDNMLKLNQEYEIYLKDCDQKYQLSGDQKPTISHVAYLLGQINPDESSSQYLLVEGIKTAIIYYIKQTFTNETLQNKERAASQNRINDMYDILKLVETHQNDPQLKMIINNRLDTFKQGMFNTNLFLFKHFGKSDLKNKIKSIITQYEDYNTKKQAAAANDKKFAAVHRAKSFPPR